MNNMNVLILNNRRFRKSKKKKKQTNIIITTTPPKKKTVKGKKIVLQCLQDSIHFIILSSLSPIMILFLNQTKEMVCNINTRFGRHI